METTTKKDERSEYISIWVTPKVKSELEFAKDNPDLRESILKRYLNGEKDFMEQEISAIDEVTVKYKARLIGIKDSFSKAQDIYVDEIEKLFVNVSDADKKISAGLVNSKDKLFQLNASINNLNSDLNKLNFNQLIDITNKIERLMDVLDRFNKMPENEKELLKSLLIK